MNISRARFDHIVSEAIARIPEEFRRHLDNILISVQPRPSQELLDDLGLPPEEPLLGIFQGVPLTERSVTAPPLLPDTIFLFQKPLESICTTTEELIEEVEITVVHEIAHYLGIDEKRLAELGYG